MDIKDRMKKHLQLYSYMTVNERLKLHQECLDKLAKIPKGNYYAGKKFLGY